MNANSDRNALLANIDNAMAKAEKKRLKHLAAMLEELEVTIHSIATPCKSWPESGWIIGFTFEPMDNARIERIKHYLDVYNDIFRSPSFAAKDFHLSVFHPAGLLSLDGNGNIDKEREST